MPIILDEKANERSSYFPIITFRDEPGALVVPITATWTLLDGLGAVVNARNNVPISPLASVVTLVLHGADLAVGVAGVARDLVIQSTYNSTLGNGLENNEVIHFDIEPLPGI